MTSAVDAITKTQAPVTKCVRRGRSSLSTKPAGLRNQRTPLHTLLERSEASSTRRGNQNCLRRSSNCAASSTTTTPMIVGTPGMSPTTGMSTMIPGMSKSGPNER
jgi:hypothetical protein